MSETDGPVAMMLSILDGEIAEGVEISVNFFTQDGTAIGKTIVITYIIIYCAHSS